MKSINKSKITFGTTVIAGCSILLSFGSVNALDTKTQLKLGEMEYLSSCGSCHGKDAKGNGPVASVLTVKPSDLTLISKKSDGKFPEEYIYKIIDGREISSPHGDSAMPVWGHRFTVMEYEVADAIAYPPQDIDTQSLVFGRIMSLVGYLKSIQTK